jgi:hypothetical protein
LRILAEEFDVGHESPPSGLSALTEPLTAAVALTTRRGCNFVPVDFLGSRHVVPLSRDVSYRRLRTDL